MKAPSDVVLLDRSAGSVSESPTGYMVVLIIHLLSYQDLVAKYAYYAIKVLYDAGFRRSMQILSLNFKFSLLVKMFLKCCELSTRLEINCKQEAEAARKLTTIKKNLTWIKFLNWFYNNA